MALPRSRQVEQFLILLFGSLLLAGQMALAQTAPGQAPKAIAETHILTEKQRWAIACSALLDEVNHYNHDQLATQERTPDNISRQKETLVQFWVVNNRADLINNLDWIDKDGHRKMFEELGAALNNKDHARISQLKSKYLNSEEAYTNMVRVSKAHYKSFGRKSLIAYDYCAYIDLCRWGYLAGYLTEQEAWARIMPAARLLQKTYSSWQDLARNYIIGREFCSANQTADAAKEFERCYDFLVKEPSSPWVKLPWHLRLE